MTGRQPPSGLVHNILAGLTVSFVAISLGAAFGILSNRGAFAGIISAGIIAVITAAFGGTRVQCSGPTAPMTALTATLFAFAHDQLLATTPNANPDHFINGVLILTGALLVLAGMFRLGRFIALVPHVVISGFMDGIAILIWADQLRKLTGLGGQAPFGGGIPANAVVAGVTLAGIFLLPRLITRTIPRWAHLVPATLVTIIGVTVVSALIGLDVERVNLQTSISSLGDIAALAREQFPTDWTLAFTVRALPFAFELAMLCYLDTLLTSLVVDRMTGERTAQNRELGAQGVANSLAGLIGGIPGAQATIRSVLIVKERATLRLAGVAVGVFVLVELLLFQHLIGTIPQAVFTGLLIKVGWDVFDTLPLRGYLQHLRGTPSPEGIGLSVGHGEMAFVVGTTLTTVFWNLNVAVIGFAILFHLAQRWIGLPDLQVELETADVSHED